MSNLLRPGEYAYYMLTEDNGTPSPIELVKLLEQDNGYWAVQFQSGNRNLVLPTALRGIDDNRMREWGNKARRIRVRNMAGFTRRNSLRRNRSNRRSNRSRRGGAYLVRPRFHIGQRVEVKWLNERGGFSWQPATVTRISYKANGEYHLITFQLDRMPGHYHQTSEYVRPLNNNAMAVN